MRTSRAPSFAAVAAAALSLLVAGCGGSGRSANTTTTTVREPSGVVWLCRPGLADNPCVSDLTTTAVSPSGGVHIERLRPAAKPPVDCFYVYPTISDETTVNADLAVGFREREVAIAQASRFSQACRVFAPVYRQITLHALEHPRRITRADALIAYHSVVSAFHDYLSHYNDGRGIVFIGHSQGAAILVRLIQREVDGEPALRRRLVSALLLGGNVTVARGRGTGGDFNHIPECASRSQTGCVVAYSSFTKTPPANSQFGRTTSDAGVALLAPRKRSRGLRIMCVNPAALAGGTAPLDPAFPALVLAFFGRGGPSVTTPWVSFPGRYTGRCETSGGASWLQIAAVGRDGRSAIERLDEGALGLHILDVNVALDDLVRLVRSEAAAFLRH